MSGPPCNRSSVRRTRSSSLTNPRWSSTGSQLQGPDQSRLRLHANGRERVRADLRSAHLPGDVATTTTLPGATVPFVVRVETGTMNRGVYQNVVLHDPTRIRADAVLAAARLEPAPDRACTARGCPGGWYVQGGVDGRQPAEPHAAWRGLRALHQHTQSPDQQLQPVSPAKRR